MARVLVTEDDPVNMKLAVLLLHNAGHTVLCAADAETGLTLARAELPDLILMDFQLPGMDGVAATALLKQDPATAAIPVIALTATAMPTEKPSAGCDEYLAKPLRYLELYAAINSLLVKRERQVPAPMHLPGSAGVSPAPWGRGHSFGELRTGSGRRAGEVPALPGEKVVDVRILENLLGNNPAVMHKFLHEFRINAAKAGLALKTACTGGQAEQVSRQAHRLKASARTVGALAFGELCATMEAAGEAGDTAMLTVLLPLFEQELDAVNAFLDALPAPRTDHRPHP